uniref:Putative secreted protein n=1 Tax=Xenopsylla cheopis TaxID=163159 RepID=A0A6M2DV19_XENCH
MLMIMFLLETSFVVGTKKDANMIGMQRRRQEEERNLHKSYGGPLRNSVWLSLATAEEKYTSLQITGHEEM